MERMGFQDGGEIFLSMLERIGDDFVNHKGDRVDRYTPRSFTTMRQVQDEDQSHCMLLILSCLSFWSNNAALHAAPL